LEAFLSFLSAVEEYQVEINTLYTPPSEEERHNLPTKQLEAREALRIQVEKAGDVLGVVADGMCIFALDL
jgi:nucleoporin NDC1